MEVCCETLFLRLKHICIKFLLRNPLIIFYPLKSVSPSTRDSAYYDEFERSSAIVLHVLYESRVNSRCISHHSFYLRRPSKLHSLQPSFSHRISNAVAETSGMDDESLYACILME
jgi:hypothetical protein